MMTKISAFVLITLCIQYCMDPVSATDPAAATEANPSGGAGSQGSGNTGGLSYWEKEFQDNAQRFYQHFEAFFVDFVIPAYHMVKESALLTTAVLLVFILYFTKAFLGLFKGDGTKKFKYNKEEPISYSDLNQHFKNFTKELDELKQQVKKGPESAGAETQAAGNTANAPELEKLSKSLGKTEDHLTKLYQENKQLNQFLASFQREILESHKEIWKELHSLKTARATAASSKSERTKSVSAEDRIPKRLQDTGSRAGQLEGSHRAKETVSRPVDAGIQKSGAQNGTNIETRQHATPGDSSVVKSQEVPRTGQQQEHAAPTETKKTENANPFLDSPDKVEQKQPLTQTNPTARQPGFQRPTTQARPPFGGPMKQPPMMNTPDTQPQKPEQKEETQKPTTTETNPFASTDKPTNPTELTTEAETKPTNPEEEKSTTTEQTNPDTDSTQIPGMGAGAFKGLPAKKPTPVVRNNFAVPQKRVNPVPGNIKKPPIMNPGANFVPNTDGGSGPSI